MQRIPESMAWLAKPDGTVVVGHGPFTEAASPPPAGTAFYVRGFGPVCPSPWKIPARSERLPIAEFADRFSDLPLPPCEWEPIDAAPFSSVFQEVMSSIRGGQFEKTVPVVVEKGHCSENPALPLIAAMTRHASPLRSYGWAQGDYGFAGATPELLFTLNGLEIESMALAGTARREDRDVFAVDEKEIREHEYVAQTLLSKLHALGNPIKDPRRILDLGPIVHFLTLIRMVLDHPRTPADLIDLLHPTPALGPLPRTKETMSLLLDWRKRLGCPEEFGAPFGIWESGSFDAVVAIRGIWWSGSELVLPAGCGVIEASRLVNEWRELRLKREAVKRLIHHE